MNYFAAQDAARKRTGRLVILFLLAVVGVVAALYLPLAAIASSEGELPFWNPPLLGGIAVAVLLVVGLGSLFKIAQLGKGGSAVAEMLGGTLVDPATRDPELRRLMNVVAEMAIASGVPVPPVYLIEEDSINAFAAGYTPQSAVIGVTRGCVRQLDRPQLQGVMAHEFSHILNGDMRLNIRLAGVIFGILVIGVLGWGLFRYVGPMLLYSRGGGGNRNNGGAVGLGIIAFGLLLMAVGAIGTMFGRLIQAAVSRQREFLADASAVQFTRNPRGIAGALRKIGGMPASRGWNAHVSEFGHFFFTPAFAALFATHPPLKLRIARIEGVDAAAIEAAAPSPPSPVAAAGSRLGEAAPPLRNIATPEISAAASRIGEVAPKDVEVAARLVRSLPAIVVDACREPMDARGVIAATLLSGDAGHRDAQRHALSGDPGLVASTDRLAEPVRRLSKPQRLAAIDLAVPALCELSEPQYRDFRHRLTAVILADRTVGLFEWVVRTVLERHVEARFAPPKAERRRQSLERRRDSAVRVLATLAHAGHADAGEAEAAFRAAISTLGWSEVPCPDRASIALDGLDEALQRLGDLRMTERQRLLAACIASIDHDGETSLDELLLLRAVADRLDCPMPPVTA